MKNLNTFGGRCLYGTSHSPIHLAAMTLQLFGLFESWNSYSLIATNAIYVRKFGSKFPFSSPISYEMSLYLELWLKRKLYRQTFTHPSTWSSVVLLAGAQSQTRKSAIHHWTCMNFNLLSYLPTTKFFFFSKSNMTPFSVLCILCLKIYMNDNRPCFLPFYVKFCLLAMFLSKW